MPTPREGMLMLLWWRRGGKAQEGHSVTVQVLVQKTKVAKLDETWEAKD